MNYFKAAFNYLFGNAITQKVGRQDRTPSDSAYDENINISVDSSLQISTVWACVTLLVETISSLPLDVYLNNVKGSREKAYGTLPYALFHDSPNKRQTTLEFWEHMLLNFFLRGNCYAIIKRNARGEAVSLWPISSDQVDVFSLDDGTLIYVYTVNKKEVIYLERDILHIKGMGNGTVGMSPLDYMKSSLGLAISAQNHTVKTLKKDARRPGILMSDTVLTKDQRVSLKKRFNDIVTGGGQELYILEAALKFQPLGMSPSDIQLLETRKFAVQDLARWFGVPSVLINDTGETTSLGSSVQMIVDGFYKLKLRPQLSRIEKAINKRVFTPAQRAKGFIVEFNFDALLRASLIDRMEIGSKGVQNGLITRNEWRKKENKEEIEGGDILTAQSNLMPLDQLGQQVNSGGSVPVDTVRQ